jgi:hypothetical protein
MHLNEALIALLIGLPLGYHMNLTPMLAAMFTPGIYYLLIWMH